MRFTVGAKLGAGYLALTLLLVASGVAAYLATNSLKDSLELVTGPVQGTADGVALGIRGVQMQMIGVDKALRLSIHEAGPILEQGRALTRQAYRRITELNLLSAQRLAQLDAATERFDRGREALLELDQAYRTELAALGSNIDKVQGLLLEIEEIASQVLVEAEWNANLAEGEDAGSRDTEAWAVVAAGTEARLALMTRLYEFRRILTSPQDTEIRQSADNALADFHIYTAEVSDAKMLVDQTAKSGPYAGISYREALTDLVAEHERTFEQALRSNRQLEQARLEYSATADKLMRLAAEIERDSKDLSRAELRQAQSAESITTTGMLIIFVTGLVLAAAAYWISMRVVARPVAQAAIRLQEISEGDGDLTVRLEEEGADEVTDLCRAFNRFLQKVEGIIADVTRAVGQLTDSAGQLLQQHGEDATRLQSQQNDTFQVAQEMEEMAASVAEVASSAEVALGSAKQAEAEAVEGHATVGRTIAAIERLAQQVEEATATMQTLERETEAIGGVLDVIGSIAEQTNLLALNAAIEAARAGEHGRGFAVVADEVRTLANRTQQSTSEIQRMIERLQNGARAAAGVMSLGQDQARLTVEEGARTEHALERIREAVTSIHGQNRQIATAAEQQSASSSKINEGIARINDLGQEIVHSSQTTAGAAETLNQLSRQLRGLVQQFRINTGKD